MKCDLIVTWPKSRSLDSYLEELSHAEELGFDINYRVSQPPTIDYGAWRERAGRCYIVHDGAIRGYNEIRYITYRQDGEVSRVKNDAYAGCWPAGWYIVRDPAWHPVEPIPMKGFRGFRYFNPARTDGR